MDRGIYIAASGMLAEQTIQNQIANDLANASTPGYKATSSSQASFGQMLLENSSTGQIIGSTSQGTQIGKTTTDMAPASLEQTGEPLDLGLDGPGFLSVQTPTGTRYTRDGQLDVNAVGQLETATGYPVLDTANQPIKVGTSANLAISPEGVLSRNGTTLATLNVVSLTNPVQQGDTLFAGTAGARPAGTAVRQGYLESSGVDPTTAMVDMLNTLRTYQSDEQAIQTINQTLSAGIQAGGL